MKNLENVKREIGDIENTSKVEIKEMKPTTWRKQLKKLELLRLLLKYIETSPTEKFVRDEIERLEFTITLKSQEFDSSKYEERSVPKKEISKLKKAHEAIYGLSKMRAQVRTLRMLLK